MALAKTGNGGLKACLHRSPASDDRQLLHGAGSQLLQGVLRHIGAAQTVVPLARSRLRSGPRHKSKKWYASRRESDCPPDSGPNATGRYRSL